MQVSACVWLKIGSIHVLRSGSRRSCTVKAFTELLANKKDLNIRFGNLAAKHVLHAVSRFPILKCWQVCVTQFVTVFVK